MKLVDGIWLPDEEKHFPEWWNSPKNKEFIDGKATYQIRKLRAAMEYVKQFRVAIDCGGHIGTWSMHLAKRFQTLHAFEPVAAFRECFLKNVEAKNVLLYPVALGAQNGSVAMHIDPADTGGTHVACDGDIEMRTLDEFDFADVDFLKIDCEGYEHHVVAGARETLLRCRPCVIVEQKQHIMGRNFGLKGTPAVDILKILGARVVREISGDYIMVFE